MLNRRTVIKRRLAPGRGPSVVDRDRARGHGNGPCVACDHGQSPLEFYHDELRTVDDLAPRDDLTLTSTQLSRGGILFGNFRWTLRKYWPHG